MNNASGEHVEDHVQVVESEQAGKEEGRGGMCKEIQKQPPRPSDPTRWWFASSAFPMIAGTLGPVASAFSICALVKPWRQHMPPGTEILHAAFINDPEWLLIVNALQLVVALIANLFLLLNMARRVSFTVAMPVTIVGWYLSSFSLIALTATASGLIILQPVDEHIWSQAFYYGVFSAVLYFIVATLLVVTAMGASARKYDMDFQLTTSQRTLMLQTIMFLMYLLLGALVFSTIEGWAYLDAVYWADVTLFTVGFGDVRPSTTLGRSLLFPYALVGVISLGLVIGSIRSLMLERGRRMIDARIVEKKRRTVLRRLTNRGANNILVPIRTSTLELAAQDRGSEGPYPSPLRRETIASSGKYHSSNKRGNQPQTELERREQEFRLMRRIQKQAASRRRWVAMALSSGTWVVLWLVGALIFRNCEADYQGWTYFDSVYFAFVSLTTIGYGDVTPISNSGRAFFVFWSLLALPTMTVLISNAGDTVVKSIRDVTNELGGMTILPGEEGMMKDMKAILKAFSCGMLFNEDVEDVPPGFLGSARRRRSPSSDDNSDDGSEAEAEMNAKSEDALADEEKVLRETDSPDSDGDVGGPSSHPRTSKAPPLDAEFAAKTQQLQQQGTAREGEGGSSPSSNNVAKTPSTATTPSPSIRMMDIPRDRADYHVILVDEIERVSRHMRRKPPRKYTYAEWAWYLALMGEDERSAETHRRARPHVRNRHHGGSSVVSAIASALSTHGGGSSDGGANVRSSEKGPDPGDDADSKDGQWSWVGIRSPLLESGKDEAEWIHEKLVMQLAKELRSVREEARGKTRMG